MKKVFTLVLLLSACLSFSQNMKKEKMTVSYIQPPMVHLEEGMGYTSQVILDYEEEINAELAKAEEEYQQALAEYPDKEAAAKARREALKRQQELLDNIKISLALVLVFSIAIGLFIFLLTNL